MSTYSAPSDDMQFVVKELIGLEEISQLPGFEEVTPDLVDAVIEEAGKFATGVLDPLNQPGDQHGAVLNEHVVTPAPGFSQAYEQFCEAGWGALANDPQWGGQGLPHTISALTSEMWNAACMSFCLCPMLTSGAIQAIKRHGTAELQAAYLPNLVSGKWSGTMNLTEPQAGSDLSAVRTRAIPQEDHYLISGQKIFITYGEHDLTANIIHLVLARTPDAPEGVKGISLFVVPKFLLDEAGEPAHRNDIKCLSLEEKLGIHASPTAVISYGEDGGAVGYLVGEENRGLQYMFTMMNIARHSVGVEGIAIAERAYQKARDYAKERIQGRSVSPGLGDRVAIVHHPDVRRMLMIMRAQVEAMRALALVAAAAYDKLRFAEEEQQRRKNQALLDFLTPVVKGWSTETGNHLASLGLQIHGGMGFIEETGAAQYFRDARITTIYEGTTGIQANDFIGRKLARDNGQVAFAVIDEMKALAINLGESEHQDLNRISHSFNKGITDLEKATRWLLDNYQDHPEAVSVAACDLLMLWGAVCGAWQMAKAADRACKRLSSGSINSGFLQDKIKTALFYHKHLLPRAGGLVDAIVEGSDYQLMLDAEAL